MRLLDVATGLTEDGRIVKGVNTTQDVGTNQTSIEAAKFGNKVDKDGRPPLLKTGSTVNKLFNMGLAEMMEYGKTNKPDNALIQACLEGGHSVDDLLETTSAGSVASVNVPVGTMVKRNPDGTVVNALDVNTNLLGGKSAINKNKRKPKMKKKNVREGLSDYAETVDNDHRIDMAKSELYKLAEYSVKIYNLLKTATDSEILEAWQQAKITKASDYISSVYHNMSYNSKTKTFGENTNPNQAAIDNLMRQKESMMQRIEALQKRIDSLVSAGGGQDQEQQDGTQPMGQQGAQDQGQQGSQTQRQRPGGSIGTIGTQMNSRFESADPYKQKLGRLYEKALSKAQQKAAGAALAAKRGDTPKSSLKGAAKSMSKMKKGDLEDFAKTKHKGLPNKKGK